MHWLDMTRLFFGEQKLEKIFATDAFAPNQEIGVPMMASVLARFDCGSAVLDFDGHSRYAAEERFSIRGTAGTLRASGGVCSARHIEVENQDGAASIDVEGSWFPDGFAGTMGELLCSIEEDREPENNAADNLKSLELDLFAVLGALRREAGFRGKIGFQGYSWGGGIHAKLERSLAYFRRMEDRLNRHPEWAILDRRPGQPLRRG